MPGKPADPRKERISDAFEAVDEAVNELCHAIELARSAQQNGYVYDARARIIEAQGHASEARERLNTLLDEVRS